MGEPFQDLVAGGPWGDFVSNYFSCSHCGQLFHLHAETYHGSGGALRKFRLYKNRSKVAKVPHNIPVKGAPFGRWTLRDTPRSAG